MFTERLNALLEDVCHTTTGEFAKVGKYDRSYIAHLRNGDRIPAQGHRASVRLSHAIYRCAAQKDSVRQLCEYLAIPLPAGEARVSSAINAWLYEEQPLGRLARAEEAENSGGLFAKKLVAAMELADISNQKLARELNVDSSVTSKYRSGLRSLRTDSPRIAEIAAALAPRIRTLDRVEALARLVGVERKELEDEAECARRLETWLRAFKSTDAALVESFLDDMDNFAPKPAQPLLPPERAAGEAAKDTDTAYEGTGGLQRAVLRFLCDAIREKKPELRLYSDQKMDWMVGERDFLLRWTSLMNAYVRGGGRIQIIHNVDRGLHEMLAAIRSWLPLYASGGIESWYCLRENGERFFHTQFLAENACVSACFITGCEEQARYDYIVKSEELAYCKRFYEELLKNSRPLFSAEPSGTRASLSALRDGKTAHRIANTLSLASMPRSLLGRIFDRAGLSEEMRREISSDWFDASALLADKIGGGQTVHECVWLPDRETLAAGRIPIDTERAELFYTPEEYAGHLRYILALARKHPAYRFHPLEEMPFQQLRIIVSEQMTTFGGFASHALDFTATHPMMCRAFADFAEQIELQNEYDDQTLEKKLSEYI